MNAPPQRQTGFSLPELLVVLGLLALLLTMPVPPFMRNLPKMRLRTASDQLAADVTLARSTALELRSAASLTYDSARRTFLLTLLAIAVLFVLGSAFVVVSVTGYKSASLQAASMSALYVAVSTPAQRITYNGTALKRFSDGALQQPPPAADSSAPADSASSSSRPRLSP